MSQTPKIVPVSPLSAMVSLFQPGSNAIRGVDTADWFGPLQPVRPIAPVGTEPRGLQYLAGQNLIFTPRQGRRSFDDLRAAAKYDMVAVVIENVKDSVCRIVPDVRLRRRPGESAKDYAKRKPDPAILSLLSDLIRYPSGVHSEEAYAEFTRKIVHEMLVIDAPAILFRASKSNDLIEMRAIQGDTITRYIDEEGYTPQPPDPAYAQLWYGIPMVNLTTDQLLYCPRNLQPGELYGTSPVEQVLSFIEFGANRLKFQKSYYTEGTLPDAIQIVPPNADPKKIEESQLWMNSELAGNLAKRRQLRYMQGFTPDGKDQVIFPKEVLLTDGTDDMIFRALFYAFGQSATRVIPMMNRATSQQNSAEAEKEGLEPYLQWLIDSVWNRVIQRYLGFEDYEAIIPEDTSVDPLMQAQIDKSDVDSGIRRRNEIREDRGYEPAQEPEADMLTTAAEIIPISGDEAVKRAKAKADAMPAPTPGFGGGSFGPPSTEDKAAQKALIELATGLHDRAVELVRIEKGRK